MKIKIISYQGEYHHDFESWIMHDVTDWEEVDQETYNQLSGWCKMQNDRSRSNREYIIFRQEQLDIKRSVADYMAHIQAEAQAQAKRRAHAEHRRKLKQAAKRRLEESQEIELMNQLLAKHGDKAK